jgi:hypothetical protein
MEDEESSIVTCSLWTACHTIVNSFDLKTHTKSETVWFVQKFSLIFNLRDFVRLLHDFGSFR